MVPGSGSGLPRGLRRTRQARVLVADDDPAVLDLLKGLLRELGACVSTAEAGREAVVQVAADPPDLLLLDLAMPGFSGLDVLRDIRDLEVDTAVIVLSGRIDEVTAEMCRELGADGVVAKPFDLDQMQSVLAPLLKLRNS